MRVFTRAAIDLILEIVAGALNPDNPATTPLLMERFRVALTHTTRETPIPRGGPDRAVFSPEEIGIAILTLRDTCFPDAGERQLCAWALAHAKHPSPAQIALAVERGVR